MFYAADKFSFVPALLDAYPIIMREFTDLANSEFLDWPEHSLYGEEGWKTFGLYAFGQRQPKGCDRCPETARIVKQIPGLMMAGFSRLAPGARIVPHCGYEGYAGYVLRLHVGIDVPSGCALRVGSETREWRNGECLIFDDSIEHEAWNSSNKSRTVLLIDFINPLRKQPLVLNPKFTPELIRFIESEHLPTQSLGQRLLWKVWKLANPRLAREAAKNVGADRL